MGWFKGRLSRSEADRPTRPVCDSCGAELERTKSYYLATRDVVLSESYWTTHFTLVKALQDKLVMDDSQQLGVFDETLRVASGQRSPWGICENCSELFTFDRDEARSCAIRDVAPPRSGPVHPAECTLFAAAAWERVFDRWPANVPQPEVAYTCDFCEKKIYAGEIADVIPRTRMQQLRAEGIIEHDPVSGPRPGTDTWVSCQPCMARQLASQYRRR
ncbi:MAG: hypothetical protein JOZ47_05920 [Kutzneria sp.]|nr:hypothetical protein [Kutzneria sp.]MBV9844589.1 hypothetical protein [Kutzneria sp.]